MHSLDLPSTSSCSKVRKYVWGEACNVSATSYFTLRKKHNLKPFSYVSNSAPLPPSGRWQLVLCCDFQQLSPTSTGSQLQTKLWSLQKAYTSQTFFVVTQWFFFFQPFLISLQNVLFANIRICFILLVLYQLINTTKTIKDIILAGCSGTCL
jgi:hypothetical protein